MRAKTIFLAAIIAVLFSPFQTVLGDEVDTAVEELSHPETRTMALKKISDLGPKALPHLKKLCEDKSQPDHVMARLAMGRVGGEEAAEELRGAVIKDSNPRDREASAIALGHMKDKKSLVHLKKAAKDPNGNVRMRALWAMAQMGDTSGKKQAVQAIASQDVTEQVLAIEALEAFKAKDAIPSLKAMYNHENPFTKINAKMAVARLESQELKGKDRADFMKKVLQEPGYEVQRWAAHQLAILAFPADGTPNPEPLNQLKQIAADEKHSGSYAARKELRILKSEGKLEEGSFQ